VRRRMTALLLAFMMLSASAACGTRTMGEGEGYRLYYLSVDSDRHGPALEGELWQPEEEGTVPTAEELLRALLEGPAGEELRSPFPAGVSLIRVERDIDEPEKVRVRLSEAYSGLSDISLTLADYAIVLTLTQLDSVESVEIQANGYSANYRSHTQLKPEEALLTDPLDAADGFA